jgi:hypothetical protein
VSSKHDRLVLLVLLLTQLQLVLLLWDCTYPSQIVSPHSPHTPVKTKAFLVCSTEILLRRQLYFPYVQITGGAEGAWTYPSVTLREAGLQ